MMWLLVLAVWLIVMIGGGVLLARTMAFGDRPSAPEMAAGLLPSGRPASAVAAAPVARQTTAPVLSLG